MSSRSRCVSRFALLPGALLACCFVAAPTLAADPKTRRVSVDSAEGQATGGDNSGFPSISADGRFVAFFSDANNLVANDTNGAWDVFVRGPLQ